MPRVSVIIPTYNRKDYVQLTIDSVLAQTYTDYEIIVIDDGSKDTTGETLNARYGDRIRYIWQENQGESVARNHGIEISQGEYIALLDSDDLWLPEKLAKQVNILEKNLDMVLIFSASWQIDASGQRLDDAPSFIDVMNDQLSLESLCLNNVMGNAGSTAVIRKKPLEGMEKFDPTIRYGEDWDLWLRLRCHGVFGSLNEPLAFIRQHGGSQWHNPRPETIDQRLTDHKRMLEKIFTNWPGEIPEGLPERALARAYGIAGYLDYSIGRVSLGKDRFKHALELDPDYRSELKKYSEQLRHQFLYSNSEISAYGSSKTTLKLAIMAFDNWPDELEFSRQWRTQLYRDIFLHFFYVSYNEHDFSTTRYCLINTIRYDPFLLSNKGIWSIGLEAILGTRIVKKLRLYKISLLKRRDTFLEL